MLHHFHQRNPACTVIRTKFSCVFVTKEMVITILTEEKTRFDATMEQTEKSRIKHTKDSYPHKKDIKPPFSCSSTSSSRNSCIISHFFSNSKSSFNFSASREASNPFSRSYPLSRSIITTWWSRSSSSTRCINWSVICLSLNYLFVYLHIHLFSFFCLLLCDIHFLTKSIQLFLQLRLIGKSRWISIRKLLYDFWRSYGLRWTERKLIVPNHFLLLRLFILLVCMLILYHGIFVVAILHFDMILFMFSWILKLLLQCINALTTNFQVY